MHRVKLKNIRWEKGNGTTLLGIGLVLLVLVLFFSYFYIHLLESLTYDMQLAADSMSDSIAVYGYKEDGTYDEAVQELENVTDMIIGNTSLLPKDFADLNGTVTLDKDKYENDNIALVTVQMTVAPVVKFFGTDTVTFTRDSETYFPESRLNNTYRGSSNVPYVQWCINIANDDTHGYSQDSRGGNPDYDCSSLVSSALVESGMYKGVSRLWTTWSLESNLPAIGFEKHTYNVNELQEGDILITNESGKEHVEIYLGEVDGQPWSIGAHDDYDGHTGDGNGLEISAGAISRTYQYYFRDPDLAEKIKYEAKNSSKSDSNNTNETDKADNDTKTA